MKRTRGALVACAVLCLLAPAGAGAANKVAGGVLGTGGNPATGSTGSNKVLYGTVGQTVVGQSNGAAHNLCHGFWCFGGVRVVSVDDGPGGSRVPTLLALSLPAPNPMVSRMSMDLSLPRASDVRVDVYDLQGRAVGAMHAGRLDPGVYRLEWDGTDGDGHASGAGVYFARLLVDGRFVVQHRFVRLR
jgi:hypothetical protein